jgi:hypothetical protein
MHLSTWLMKGAALVVVVLLGAFIALSLSIGTGVREASQAAVAEYGTSPVDALISVVESETHPLVQRNRAVWALGQLGDPRALPVLERHYTGGSCDHAHGICQHELQKAIRLCRGSTNLTARIWR